MGFLQNLKDKAEKFIEQNKQAATDKHEKAKERAERGTNKDLDYFKDNCLKNDEEIIEWAKGSVGHGLKVYSENKLQLGVLVITSKTLYFCSAGGFAKDEVEQQIPLNTIQTLEKRRQSTKTQFFIHTSHDRMVFTSHEFKPLTDTVYNCLKEQHSKV